MKFKIAGWAAVSVAVIYFLYSVIQLLGYGISVGAISASLLQNSILNFLVMKIKIITIVLLVLNFLASFVIYMGFFSFGKKTKQFFLKSMSIVVLICSFLVFLFTFLVFAYPKIYLSLNIKLGLIEALFGVASLIFGIFLVRLKESSSGLLKSLGIFYILEGLVLLSGLLFPMRIVDFTIAIAILEAVFFFGIAKANKK